MSWHTARHVYYPWYNIKHIPAVQSCKYILIVGMSTLCHLFIIYYYISILYLYQLHICPGRQLKSHLSYLEISLSIMSRNCRTQGLEHQAKKWGLLLLLSIEHCTLCCVVVTVEWDDETWVLFSALLSFGGKQRVRAPRDDLCIGLCVKTRPGHNLNTTQMFWNSPWK